MSSHFYTGTIQREGKRWIVLIWRNNEEPVASYWDYGKAHVQATARRSYPIKGKIIPIWKRV